VADFDPDQFLAQGATAPGKAVGVDASNFDPDQFLNQKSNEQYDALQSKYGTPEQQMLAGLEATARTATLGGSDWLEPRLGISTAENIKAREEANPGISTAGSVVGGFVTPIGKLGKLIEGSLAAKGVAPLAARALGYGSEGAAYGAGQLDSDIALGDKDLNAQKIFSTIGVGTILGSGLGLLNYGIVSKFPGASKVLGENPKSLEPLNAIQDEAGLSQAEVAAGLGENVATNTGKPEPTELYGMNPESVEEMKQRYKDLDYSPIKEERPLRSAVEESIQRNPLKRVPVLDAQLDNLSNPDPKNPYQIAREMSGEAGDVVRNYESAQKAEALRETDQTIASLHPEEKPINKALDAGEDAIKTFTDQYQKEKSALGPSFEALKKLGGQGQHFANVYDRLTQDIPALKGIFGGFGEDGKIKFNEYNLRMGIDKATYTAFKDLLKGVEEPSSIQDLMNVRKGLTQYIDYGVGGTSKNEVTSMKASMMDYIKHVVGGSGGEGSLASDTREIFKRYAINEQERQIIEREFGASVGEKNFGKTDSVSPEKVLDAIFRNTAHVRAAKQILEPADFNKMLSNYLAVQREKATTDGVFSSRKFYTFMKGKMPQLQTAFETDSPAFQKILDKNTQMRLLPDAPSVNPPHSAGTLISALSKATSPGDLIGGLKELGQEKVKNYIVKQRLNQVLKEEAKKSAGLDSIKQMVEKTSSKMEKGAKAIFNPNTIDKTRSGIEAAGAKLSDDQYKKIKNRVAELANNPDMLAEHLSDGTKDLYTMAPNITQGLHNTIVNSVQFLNSKIPKSNLSGPLDVEKKPSEAEISKFSKYYEAVDNPLSVFQKVKSGDLSNESLEALAAVHPHLLDDMRSKVIQNMNVDKAQKMAYASKISLAKFLGQPLEANMIPQIIGGYQQLLSGPALSNQGNQKSTLGGLKQLDLAGRTKTQYRNETEEG
jgi:hypothetical protein